MQDAAAGGRKQFRDCQVPTAAASYVFGSMANNPVPSTRDYRKINCLLPLPPAYYIQIGK